jgi:hypothetical protein
MFSNAYFDFLPTHSIRTNDPIKTTNVFGKMLGSVNKDLDKIVDKIDFA